MWQRGIHHSRLVQNCIIDNLYQRYSKKRLASAREKDVEGKQGRLMRCLKPAFYGSKAQP